MGRGLRARGRAGRPVLSCRSDDAAVVVPPYGCRVAGAPSSTTFGRDSTLPVLHEACRRAGLSGDGAELLRLGENAIYRLEANPVVVRIARSPERRTDAVKEVQVSRWLAEEDVRATRLAQVADQPFEVDGHPVTFWEFIDGRRGRPGDVRQLGRLLRSVHGLPSSGPVDLPEFDPLARVVGRIDRAPIPDGDRRDLRRALASAVAELAGLRFPLDRCVLHGDAHVQNLMVPADGIPVLIDLENVGIGQPEWDLAVTATEYLVAGFWTDAQYADFVEGYGFDVTEWAGFESLRQVQAIKMTTWLMQNANESEEIRDEYERRMRSIRDGVARRDWSPF